VTPASNFTCPTCHEDYLEYEDPPVPPVPPVRNFIWRFGNPPVGFGTFNPLEIFNTFFAQGQNQEMGAPLQNWFRGILENIPFFNPAGREGGPQFGDFFMGDERQLQDLIERLNQWNARSMGSPPTAPDFMAALTPAPYRSGNAADNVCAVCLEEFEEGTEVIVLPCKHGFHTNCLTPWLKMHSECPYCRYKLPNAE
jgi:hypothetical protein